MVARVYRVSVLALEAEIAAAYQGLAPRLITSAC